MRCKELSTRLRIEERLEQCEDALQRYADPNNWRKCRPDGPVDEWICCDEEAWNGPDVDRAALEGK